MFFLASHVKSLFLLHSKNEIIRKVSLQKKLSVALCFEWKGAEKFDVWAFGEIVDSLIITAEKTEVL